MVTLPRKWQWKNRVNSGKPSASQWPGNPEPSSLKADCKVGR
jgi:hypothetical protein